MRKKDIIDAVGQRVYKRGLEYFEQKRVSLRDVTEDSATAAVIGSSRYLSRFSFANGRIEGSCSCPYGNRCKHVVATALAFMEERTHRNDGAMVAGHLAGMSRDELLALVEEHAVVDDGFFAQLRGAAVSKPLSDPDTVTFLTAVSSMMDDVYRAADGELKLARIVKMLKSKLDERRYVQVAEAAWACIHRLETEGGIPREPFGMDEEEGMEPDDAFYFVEVHAEACAMARVPVDEVAKLVLPLCLEDPFGDEWLAVYRKAYGMSFDIRVAAARGKR